RRGRGAAQQRQPVSSPADRFGHESLADERGRERGFGVGQRLWVDARVDEHADVAEYDALGAGELGQRLLEELAARLERFELAEDSEQPAVGLLAAAAD